MGGGSRQVLLLAWLACSCWSVVDCCAAIVPQGKTIQAIKKIDNRGRSPTESVRAISPEVTEYKKIGLHGTDGLLGRFSQNDVRTRIWRADSTERAHHSRLIQRGAGAAPCGNTTFP